MLLIFGVSAWRDSTPLAADFGVWGTCELTGWPVWGMGVSPVRAERSSAGCVARTPSSAKCGLLLLNSVIPSAAARFAKRTVLRSRGIPTVSFPPPATWRQPPSAVRPSAAPFRLCSAMTPKNRAHTHATFSLCHPERSRAIREANRAAKSRDPYRFLSTSGHVATTALGCPAERSSVSVV